MVSAASLAEIRERGYVVVGVKDNWPPLGFRESNQGSGQDQNQIQGFEIDLARRLAQTLVGREDAIQFVPLTNVGRIAAVTQGQVDFAIAGITVTPSRTRLVNFSPTYYSGGLGLITNNPKIQHWGNLAQQTVAVLTGSSAIPWLKSELPEAKLLGVASYRAALTALEAGHAAAFAGDLTVLSRWLKDYPRYRPLPGILAAQSFAVALPKGIEYDQLRSAVRSAILEWKTQGWLRQRARFWGLPTLAE